MKKARVETGSYGYDILIEEGLLQKAGELFREQGIGNRVFLIANPVVFELHAETLMKSLSSAGYDIVRLLIPEGETAKNLHTVETIYTYLIAQRADRKSTLIALGGGVTGDVVGFAAATFLRGVPYVQVPTTLLSQVDSSVGGKTGVNHRLGKNLIGAFYQPKLVCVDTSTLHTLPGREFQSGLYEVVKYGLIYDGAFFDYFESNLPKILQRESEVVANLIRRCCEIKAEVTTLDEKENDLRRILNFGHTFGHALEAATGYERFSHGEAVAYGMMAATHLSHRLKLIPDSERQRIVATILGIGPLPSAADVSFEQLAGIIQSDKKRQDAQTVLVLLSAIGKTEIRAGFDDTLLAEVWACALADAEP